jgi:cell division septum initiation protein DivIVA
VWPRFSLALAGAVVLLLTLAVPLYVLVESRGQNAQLNARLAQDKKALSSTRAALYAAQEELRRRPPAKTAEQRDMLQQRITELQTQLGRGKDELSSMRSSLAAAQEEVRRRPTTQVAEQRDVLQQRVTELQTQLAQGKDELSATRASLAAVQAVQEELRRRPPAAVAGQRDVLQPRVTEASTPVLGVAINLDSRDTGGGRGPAPPQIVTIAPDSPLVTLVLNFAPLSSASTLEVELTDESGETRWVGRAERNRSTANLTLVLPTHGYPAGKYSLAVFRVLGDTAPGRGVPSARLGKRPRGRMPLATYSLIVRALPGRVR